MLNKEQTLEDIVFEAKMFCDKDSFKKIYNNLTFVLDEVYESFSIVYDFIKNNRASVYHGYYVTTWQAIQQYSFDSGEPFAYFFKKFIINYMKRMLVSEYRVKQEYVIDDKTIDKMLGRSKDYQKKWKKRQRFINSFKNLTPKQLQTVYYTCYKYPKFDHNSIADKIGIKIRSYEDRIRLSLKKIRNYEFDSRTKKTREIVYETFVVFE